MPPLGRRYRLWPCIGTRQNRPPIVPRPDRGVTMTITSIGVGHPQPRPIIQFCAPRRITPARPPTDAGKAAPCAFSLTIRITQRDGGQDTDAPGSRTHVPGPGRQPEPRPLDEPGLASVPPIARGLQAPGLQPGRPGARPRASAASRHPADAPAHPCAVTSDQLHRRSDGPRAVRTTDEDASAVTI